MTDKILPVKKLREACEILGIPWDSPWGNLGGGMLNVELKITARHVAVISTKHDFGGGAEVRLGYYRLLETADET